MTALASHTCGCLSGLTDRQAAFLELNGMIEMFAWKVCQVRALHEASGDPAAHEVVERMLKWQAALARLQAYATEKGWSK